LSTATGGLSAGSVFSSSQRPAVVAQINGYQMLSVAGSRASRLGFSVIHLLP